MRPQRQSLVGRSIDYVASHRPQIARFALVGVATFAINFLCFHIFYGLLALEYRVAVSIAYVITVLAHFLLHRAYTFRAGDQRALDHSWKYLLMLGINYLVSLATVWIAVEVLRVSPYMGVIASTGATAGISFFAMKYFVFYERGAR